MDAPRMTPKSLAAMVDHTFLKPSGELGLIDRLCAEAVSYGFGAVMVNPAQVRRCVQLLKGSAVRVGTVIAFPLGQSTPAIKRYEIADALQMGAGEIDMVIDQMALAAGDEALVSAEMAALVELCRPARAVSKVILECCNLTDAQKVRACELAAAAGCDFVKTSTGFGTGGATIPDVQLMRRTVGPAMGVKAAGGIRDLATAMAMIQAGANRLGTSSGPAIVDELARGGNTGAPGTGHKAGGY